MHEGHRQRLVGKVKDGSTLYEHELMEVLLFNACPRRDVNDTAHALVNKFGSISGVLKASVEELTEVDGVGLNIAEYLRCLGKCVERANYCASFTVLKSTSDFCNFLSVRSRDGCEKLELCLVDKDGRVKIMCTIKAKEGERVKLSESDVVKYLSIYGAYGVFAAYYRTDCKNLPTGNDLEIVDNIAAGCKLCAARFFDYCVVSPTGGITSFYFTDKLENYAGHSVVRG